MGGQPWASSVPSYSVPSTEYPVPSTQYRVLSTEYPALSTEYALPALSTQYSVLGTQYFVVDRRAPYASSWSSSRGWRARPLSGAYAARSGKSEGSQWIGSQGVSPQGTDGRPRSWRTSLIVRMPYLRSISCCRQAISWLKGTGSSLATKSR